jgi:hypothetical protein
VPAQGFTPENDTKSTDGCYEFALAEKVNDKGMREVCLP